MSSPRDLDHAQCDLVGLLAGELGREETIACSRHLRSCPRCTEELVQLAVAHGALTASAVATRSLDQVPRPLGDEAVIGALAGSSSEDELPPLKVDPKSSASHDTRRRRLGFVAAGVAAAAIVLIGIGTVLAYSQGSKTSPIVASAILRPIDSPASSSGSITAVAIGDTRRLTVHTERLAALPAEEFYEVWLLDPATQKMLPVGVLPPSGIGSYSMGASIMADYSAVDVSLQTNNGNPAHSTTSVLRASF